MNIIKFVPSNPIIRSFIVSILWLGLASIATPSFAQITLKQAKPWLGVAIEKHELGVKITKILPDTPAEIAKLKGGDIIISVESTKVKTPKQLVDEIQKRVIGFEAKVIVLRNKKTLEFKIPLMARPEMLDIALKEHLNKPAPNFEVVSTTKGAPKFVSSKDLIGKVTFIHFWATWCPACRYSHGPLHEFFKKNRSKNLQFVAISDEDAKTINNYFEKKSLDFSSYSDPENKVATLFRVSALPTMIVVDNKGVVRHIGVGGGVYLEKALSVVKQLQTSNKK